MKLVAKMLGVLGILVAIVAVVGRFYNKPTVTLLGHSFAAGSILLVANTLLLLAVLVACLKCEEER